MPELTMEEMTATMTARQAELKERMDTLRREVDEAMAPLEAEHARITRALDALNGDQPARRSRRSTGRPRGGGKRADEAVAIIRAQPGITILEIAERMGIKQNYLYRLLPPLVDAGTIRRDGRSYHAA